MGCRRVASQDELVRIVRTDSGLEVSRTAPGRGAWLCARSTAECLDQAERRKAFSRALRGQVDPEAITRLRAQLG